MVKLYMGFAHKVIRFGLFLFIICGALQAGTAQLFPGLAGEPLADALRNAYSPGQLLNDTEVKDTLYAKVFLDVDSVSCIYSGLARFLPADVDPSQWLYGTGQEIESINLEHSWPQAKGAGDGTEGNTNMYHLFPSRSGINSDRANFPYGDINDNQTQKWYYKNKEMTTKPGNSINAYSEFLNGGFEPRESVKGDIARAMFYFWTIYREDAIAADPFFFEGMLDQLCLWHNQDPVDSAESSRNTIIAHYQDGKENPFIIDCSLVMRTYCSQLPECEIVSANIVEEEGYRIRFLPGLRQLSILGEKEIIWNVQIIDQIGRSLFSGQLNTNQLSLPVQLPSGLYYAIAFGEGQHLNSRIYIP